MVVAVVAITAVLAGQPAGWSCDPERFADGVCDCGCAVNDLDDCAADNADACDVDHCGELGPPRDDDNSRCDGARVLEPSQPSSSCGGTSQAALPSLPVIAMWARRCRNRSTR